MEVPLAVGDEVRVYAITPTFSCTYLAKLEPLPG
jgi:hypothetical protein